MCPIHFLQSHSQLFQVHLKHDPLHELLLVARTFSLQKSTASASQRTFIVYFTFQSFVFLSELASDPKQRQDKTHQVFPHSSTLRYSSNREKCTILVYTIHLKAEKKNVPDLNLNKSNSPDLPPQIQVQNKQEKYEYSDFMIVAYITLISRLVDIEKIFK